MLFWFKMNIYSNLLLGLSLFLFVLSWELRSVWWVSGCGAIAGLVILKFACSIYGRFEYKKEVFLKMMAKAGRKYDQRYFVPYMGSPCMRNVVYFSLRELGRQSEYREIKAKFRNGEIEKSEMDLYDYGPPPVIKVFHDGRKMQFQVVGQG